MRLDDPMGSGLDRHDFAWRKTNTDALRKWLMPMDAESLNGWLRHLENRPPCFLQRHEDGSITIEEPF